MCRIRGTYAGKTWPSKGIAEYAAEHSAVSATGMVLGFLEVNVPASKKACDKLPGMGPIWVGRRGSG